MRFVVAVGLLVSLGASAAVKHPTFVLVHGALFTSAGWMKAQSQLQNDGYNVVTLDVPGRAGDGVPPVLIDIQKAGEKVCRVVALQDEPVILVGHSQGGAVITQALAGCADRVKALVFVAAVIPLNGEIAFQTLDPNTDVNFGKCVDTDSRQNLFRLKKSGPLYSSFFQDVPADEADALVASMVDEPMGVGTTPLAYPKAKFDALPKFYIETLQDQVLTLATQRRIQARVNLRSVISMDASHSPFLSRPQEFVKNLKDIEASL